MSNGGVYKKVGKGGLFLKLVKASSYGNSPTFDFLCAYISLCNLSKFQRNGFMNTFSMW